MCPKSSTKIKMNNHHINAGRRQDWKVNLYKLELDTKIQKNFTNKNVRNITIHITTW